MSTIPTPTPSLEDKILAIINLILQGLALAVPGSATAITLGAMLIHALGALQAETGKPINFSLIPPETPVP